MTPVDAIEEVVADACEEMLLSSRLAVEMAYEKPELERSIVDWLNKRHVKAVTARIYAEC